MKVQKMSFASIKNVLSRTEMKKIMAGSSSGGGGGGGGGCPIPCAPNCNTSVLIYCVDSSMNERGTVLGNTCNLEGQLAQCSASYPNIVSTYSDCLC
jgi:hypothetical protein